MTGIVMVADDDRIIVVSDGASYDNAGRLMAPETKVVMMPERSCILAQRGAGGFVQFVRANLRGGSCLDDLLSQIVEIATLVDAGYRVYEFDRNWSIFIGGWSEDRSRFETYTLRSRSRDVPNLGTGEVVRAEPLQLQPFEGLLAAPMPSEEWRARFGLTPSTLDSMDLEEVASRVLCAARHSDYESESGATGFCGIGLFVQLTVLRRDEITSRVVHRWPDPLGERIDPARGEAMPECFTWPRKSAGR